MPQLSQSIFDKISPTALLVAYIRGFSDIPYTKELSELVNAQSVVETLLGQKLEQGSEIALLIESRYRAIDRAFTNLNSKNNCKQIIEIASGLLPRGMIMSQDPDVTFIESDLPLMMAQKIGLVKALVGDRPNLHFLSVDVTSKSNQLNACNQYLNLSQPIAVLCEGLLMYLSHAQKQQVFIYVRELLLSYGGVWITSDFVTVEAINRRKLICPSLGQISQMVSRLTDRPIGETYFQNSAQIEDFIAERGFKCDRLPVLSLIDIQQLSSLKALEIDPLIAKAVLEDAYIYKLFLH